MTFVSLSSNHVAHSAAATQQRRNRPACKGIVSGKHNFNKHGPTVATVLTRAYWQDIITLDDGTKIPPHGEVDSFTIVKQQGRWKISWLDIHNQMPPFDVKPGQPLETDLPPPEGSEPK